MKRIFTVTLLSGYAVFMLSSMAFGQQTPPPPPPPKAPKTEKHIKMVKIDDDGKKVELDTIINGNQVFVWNGDTIGGGKQLKWITKDDFEMDSIHQNFDMNFEILFQMGFASNDAPTTIEFSNVTIYRQD